MKRFAKGAAAVVVFSLMFSVSTSAFAKPNGSKSSCSSHCCHDHCYYNYCYDYCTPCYDYCYPTACCEPVVIEEPVCQPVCSYPTCSYPSYCSSNYCFPYTNICRADHCNKNVVLYKNLKK